MLREGRVADTGNPVVIFIGDDQQALWARVTESGVWMQYQPAYLNSNLSRPVLISSKIWAQFVHSINSRLTGSSPPRKEGRKQRVARTFTVHRLRNNTRGGVVG